MVGQNFDAKSGTLEARVFASPSIYREEQQRLFRRSWLLVAPLSWLSTSGAYVTNSLGELPVLAWRTKGGDVHVFVNRCRSGWGRLAQGERGEADSLRCACHGWRYTADPEFGAARPLQVLRTEAFCGFVLACQCPKAPNFADWLGDFNWCWDIVARKFPGGLDVCGEASLRTRMRCNWKLAAEAYSGDVYSDEMLSRATREVLGLGPAMGERSGLQIAAGAGAIAVALEDGVSTGDPREQMTPLLATVFPNISYDERGPALHVWHPRGVTETEVQTYCLAGRDEPDARRTESRQRCQRLFGPAGLLTQDQETVWACITAGAGAQDQRRLNLQMGLGRERRSNLLPGLQTDLASEMNQRAFYGWWQEQLASAPQSALPDTMMIRLPRQ